MKPLLGAFAFHPHTAEDPVQHAPPLPHSILLLARQIPCPRVLSRVPNPPCSRPLAPILPAALSLPARLVLLTPKFSSAFPLQSAHQRSCDASPWEEGCLLIYEVAFFPNGSNAASSTTANSTAAGFLYSGSLPQPPTAGWWCSEGSSGSGHYPFGTQSANPWGYQSRGFVNLLNQEQFPASQPPLGENFHLVGLTQPLNPISPPPPPLASGASAKQASLKQKKSTINIDGDRSARKSHWTHDEEVRLASVWLNNCNDSINGNDKKSDSFWGQITNEFNKNAAPDRTRDSNQLKVHWTRLKAVINDFNGCWSKVTKLHRSGMSDDQMMDAAQQLFIKDHGKPFALVHWWRTLKNEPKWCASVAQWEKEKNKNMPINIDDDNNRVGERPIGREAAKAKCNRKCKAEEVMNGIALLGENVNKIVTV